MSDTKCAACKGDNMEYMGHLSNFSLHACKDCGHMFAGFEKEAYNSWDDDDGY